ncbi:UNVERIFIED_CONTAM: hypothetical protein K2H54_015253, partial [Gekko kuhli]
GIDQSTLGPQPVTPSSQILGTEEVRTTSSIPGIKEPKGMEEVTTPAPVTEPEQKQTSPEPEQKQTSPDQQVGIDQSTLGPQPVTPSSQTLGTEEARTTSSVPGEGVMEPKGTEEATTPAPVTEPAQKQTSPDQQVGIDRSTLGPQPVTPSSQTPGTEEARTTSSIAGEGIKEPKGTEEVTTPAPVTEPEQKQTSPEPEQKQASPDQQVGIDQSTLGPQPVTPSSQTLGTEQARTTSSIPGIKEPKGTEEVTTPAPVTEPEQKQTSPDQQGIKEPKGMEEVTTPAPVTESAQKQTSPDQQVGIDRSTLGPQPVTPSSQTPGTEEARTTSSIAGEGIKEPKGTEEVTTPAPVTEPEQKQTSPEPEQKQASPDQQVGIDQSTLGPQPVTPSSQTLGTEQARTTSSIPGIKEPKGMEEVTTPAPVTEPEQKQTSLDQQGIMEPKGTEKVTTPAPVTEPEQKQTSPDQQVGMDQSTPGPQAVTSPFQTSAMGQVQTTLSIPGEGIKEPKGTEEVTTPAPVTESEQKQASPDQQGVQETPGMEKVTTPAPVTEPEQKQTSPDQQVGIDQSTPGPQPVTSPVQTPAMGQVQTTSPVPGGGTEEPKGTEEVIIPAPITEPEENRISPDEQAAGIDQSTPEPQPVASPAQTPTMGQAQITSPIPGEDICQTHWFNRDDPSGSGDEELLSDLRQENPNEICSAPTAMEVRTVDGVPAVQTGQEFAVNYARAGFVCLNAAQGTGRRCHDYQVQFTCPPSFCSGVKEPQGTEKVTTPVPVTEPEKKQSSPAPQVVCQTRWFNRDNPSGAGDEERLSDLRQENPNEICSAPVAIEVQTVGGIPASLTGQEFAVKDARAGFVCINAKQGRGQRCHDYQVRFACPPSFCCGVKEQPGTEEVTTPVLVTKPQPEEQEPDFVTPPAQTTPVEQIKTTPPIPDQACKTKWFDRDNPFGTGDHELLSDLLNEHPGEICSDPTAMEVQTLDGTPASETGQQFAVNEVSKGFCCFNRDQGKGVFCLDYRLRFTCPESFCAACKTKWFDHDNPFGTGDHELLSDLLNEHPGEICSDPTAMEVQTLDGTPASETGQQFAVNEVSKGFSCFHAHQGEGVFCLDYRLRFTCPKSFCTEPDRSGSKFAPQSGSKFVSAAPTQQVQTSLPVQMCKTRWFNRDHPTATGDYELLYYLRRDHPGAICSNPIALEVQTLQGIPASETGQKFASNDVVNGFACINDQQGNGAFCHDYKVQFTCPESFCSGSAQKDGNMKEKLLDD